MKETITPRKANRLLQERSPYLQQHAYNPVDWYPWSSEAFERAKAESKPIFLSIGYATCHWCHVMERESFENESVAEFLNAHFVSIKVDREEMPDVDHVYMSAVQAFSGSGGWPMTLFLTAERKPFFAGTYFPPVSAYGRPGFLDLLKRVSELWNAEPAKLLESAEALTKAISSEPRPSEDRTNLAWSEIDDRGVQYFRHVHDAELGGFGPAPKFPRPVQFDFLFDHAFRTGDQNAAEMALSTLRKMSAGGMYDQLGGGFHRYSVDKFWLVPHFEKMLYDQAQLVNAYLDAYQITHDETFAHTATGICDYVLRDLTHPEGGFYSAEDADSEGEEGTFYVWQYSAIVEILGIDQAATVAARFEITEDGNFEHHTNVLHVAKSVEQLARQFKRTTSEIETVLQESTAKLLLLRNKRERPLRDDKILTSWNGLMIGALARAGSVLGRKDYISAATKAAEFIWRELRPDGILQHRWKDGEARFDAYLESYAFLIKGLLALYRATYAEEWLSRAILLQAEQDKRLLDTSSGAYFISAERSDLLFRATGDYDGAEPNGNSVTLGNLIMLYAMQGDDQIKEQAQKLALHFRTKLAEHPYAMPLLLSNAQALERSDLQIILAGNKESTLVMNAEIAQHYVGNSVIFRASKSAPIDPFYQWLESEGPATANLCENFVCQLPMELTALRHKLSTMAFQWRAE